MSAEMAAAYLSMDEASFRRVAITGNVSPVELDLDLERWRRKDLDALLRRLPLRKPEPARPQVVQPVLDDATLDRVVERLQAKLAVPQRAAYGIKEAGHILGISHGSMYRLINTGELTPVRVLGRSLIRREDIERLLHGEGKSK
jgi:excisionase family DNA binding protein